MDEPLGALDKKLREHMQLELKQIQEQLGITILYVTHDQEEALSMSSRIAVMNQGRVEHMGTSVEIYDQPANEFVADFVGETNIFSGQVVGKQGDVLQVEGVSIPQLRIKTAKSCEVGQKIRMAVRPERVIFFEQELIGHCALAGTVTDIIFLGDITKYYIRLAVGPSTAGEGVVVMKVQNRLGAQRYRRGDSVSIGWNDLDATVV